MNKKDHFSKIKIKAEADVMKNDVRVMKLDMGAAPVVQQFSFGKLQRAGEGTYASTKAKYGSLASTDEGRVPKGQRERRFSLNPLLKEPLSIEEEERRVIEEKVAARIAAVSEEARAKAREEGYKAGLEQGHQEAYQRFAQESVERLTNFDAMLAEAENAKQEIYRANERFLMELVFRIAKMVTLKEVATDKDYVVRLARELIERIGVRENIRIRIHPEDAKTADIIKPGLEAALGTLKNLSLEASPQVKRGGCIVETEWNAIDASLETQFQGVYDALIGKTASEEGEDQSHGAKAGGEGQAQ
jgi:flagellar assembly protein FliH